MSSKIKSIILSSFIFVSGLVFWFLLYNGLYITPGALEAVLYPSLVLILWLVIISLSSFLISEKYILSIGVLLAFVSAFMVIPVKFFYFVILGF
mgnify:CR=1 FL=1